ncbi:MAG: YHS domain-containing protein [Proteobacteria bacterium]|nr:YHS domain-containing protein [Pseudomonadota bacterium]
MEQILSLALWGALLFVMMRFGCGAHLFGHRHGHQGGKETEPAGTLETHGQGLRWVPPETDLDPVCGMTVRPETAKSSVHDGTVYYFCSPECRARFEADPGRYAGGGAAKTAGSKEHSHA